MHVISHDNSLRVDVSFRSNDDDDDDVVCKSEFAPKDPTSQTYQ